MSSQSSTTDFGRGNIDNVFSALTSTDEELKNYFDRYIQYEYEEVLLERLYYLDIAEISRFLIARVKAGQTSFFQAFFIQVEVILSKCDDYVDELIVIGLFGSIQNNCGWENVDYYQRFNKWLQPISKQKWDNLIDGWEGTDWRKNDTVL